jgi:hypothetical protein
MTNTVNDVTGSDLAISLISSRVGFYSAILTTVMTIVTFGLALTAIPISGANCREACIEYPYLDTVSQFPKDYLWMFAAIVLTVVYVTMITAIHVYASGHRKLFSQLGLSFALIATIIFLCDYFIQVSVIPVSLMNGETEGIPLLIQYNPHGVFIVLEDLGYLMMSLSFLAIASVFDGQNRLEMAVRWIFRADFSLTILALVIISIAYGLDRKDRFEVLAISINWLTLIINGILLSLVFRKSLLDLLKGKVY